MYWGDKISLVVFAWRFRAQEQDPAVVKQIHGATLLSSHY
jgi:hypothetical protein